MAIGKFSYQAEEAVILIGKLANCHSAQSSNPGGTAGSCTPHPQDLRFEQNGNLQVFLSGTGDTFVILKANAKKIVTLKCI